MPWASAALLSVLIAGSSATPLLTLRDAAIDESSGLARSGRHAGLLWTHNDGGAVADIVAIDRRGRTVGRIRLRGIDPYDPEALAPGRDGRDRPALFLGDIGDNRERRPDVSVFRVTEPRRLGTHTREATWFRFRYPDGPHDAEALLLAPDGTPYLVTKEILGASGVYRPAAALVDGGTVAMEKVAAVNLTFTGTAGGPVGQAGQLLVTGGAVARDGSAVALRTYTDAYVWALTGSDVPAALAAAPARIPLPDSPQGEAISFAADNRTLVVASEGLPSDVTVVPLAAETVVAMTTPVEGAVPSLTDLTRSGLSPITNGLIAAAVATVVVWIGGKLRRSPAHRRPADRRP
jgi:hypothetical protein